MARVFKIAGETVLVDPGWTITDKINSRTTLSLKVIDLKDLLSIDNGDAIEVIDGLDTIFSGVIRNVTPEEKYVGTLFYVVKAVDNAALADKRRIAKVYENVTAGFIANEMITEKLGSEGVTAGEIQDGPIIKKAVFNYIKVSEALDYLKDIAGFVWNIDSDKKLNFFDRSTYRAPFDLTNSIQHSRFKPKKSMDEYRNVQYTRGGQTKTNEQPNEIPTPKPDGESKTFVLRFPVAEEPGIEVNLNAAGWTPIDPADVGVNGLDSGKKWYWGYNSPTLTQDDAETVLGAVDAIRVTYKGLRNLFVAIEDPVQIDQRAAVEEGSSGIYEELIIERSLNDSAQAIQYTQGQLETYGEIKDICSFSTEVKGLKAGALLRIDKPLYNINEDFLIEQVTMRRASPTAIVYTVKCLDGVAIGGWERFFKELVKKQKDFTIAADEVVIILQNQTERTGYAGTYRFIKADPLYPQPGLFPQPGLYPGGTITYEEVRND